MKPTAESETAPPAGATPPSGKSVPAPEYAAPVLRRLGTVEELTAGANAGTADAEAGFSASGG